jgi:hypothetical protein
MAGLKAFRSSRRRPRQDTRGAVGGFAGTQPFLECPAIEKKPERGVTKPGGAARIRRSLGGSEDSPQPIDHCVDSPRRGWGRSGG